MKTQSNLRRWLVTGSLIAAACGLAAARVSAQTFLVSNYGAMRNIEEFTPGSSGSVFYSPINYGYNLLYTNGIVYESDQFSGNIFTYSLQGRQSTFSSGLNNPEGLAMDSAGNLFEADSGSGNIYKFSPGGQRTLFASGLNPCALAFDSAGNLFEANYHTGTVNEFLNVDGVLSTMRIRYASRLPQPADLIFNRQGDLFVTTSSTSDGSNGSIIEITPDRERTTFASGLFNPQQMVLDGAGNMFVAVAGGEILEIKPDRSQMVYTTNVSEPTGLVILPEGAGSVAQVPFPVNEAGLVK